MIETVITRTGEHETPEPEKSAFGKLVVLMVTAFIDMLGLLMILPLVILWALVKLLPPIRPSTPESHSTSTP